MDTSTKEQTTKVYMKARERDLLFGIVLGISSIALCIYAHKISTDAIRIMDAQYFTAPGFFLLAIGIGLILMSIYLVIHSIKHGATLGWLLPKRLIARFREDKASQTILVFFYLYLYMVVFWDTIMFTKIRIPFWLNTMVFMNLVMFTFRVTKPKNIILISIITSFSVFFVFKYLIGVPLP